MRSQVAKRLRSNSVPLNSIPPAPSSTEYSTSLANLASRILYRSPLPSQNDHPVYVLNSSAFPDAKSTDYDALLPYVLARLPDDEELIGGQGYEVVFFAGGGGGNEATQTRKSRPGWGWFFQAYHVLTRATRKRLQKLYIVHAKNWIKVLVETFATVVSPKFRKKIMHVSTISGLAQHIQIQDLLIPPSAYLADRRKSPQILTPYTSERRAFCVKKPLPISVDDSPRLPRVLREATTFLLLDENIRTSGIFRTSGRAQSVEILREAYDRGQKFIVWREGDVALASNYRKEGTGDVWIEELDQTDGYDLFVACSLIKLWYKELREPIFPISSYQALDKFYSQSDISLDPPHLLAMLAMDDEWSPISSKTSRQILIMHLLPMLSKVVENSDWNHMTPENLAICISPALCRGPDPLEDMKMSTIVRRILTAMITHWKKDLAQSLDMDDYKFEESLRMPEALEDREDPLEEVQNKETSEVEAQMSGITLVDNDDSSDEDEIEGSPPPLPPRPRDHTIERKPLSRSTSSLLLKTSTNASTSGDAGPSDSVTSLSTTTPPNGISPLRRKPAPSILPLPRYSTIVNERPAGLHGMQYYNTVAPEEDHTFEELDEIDHDLPIYEEGPSEQAPTLPLRSASGLPSATESLASEGPIQRKPVPDSASKG